MKFMKFENLKNSENEEKKGIRYDNRLTNCFKIDFLINYVCFGLWIIRLLEPKYFVLKNNLLVDMLLSKYMYSVHCTPYNVQCTGNLDYLIFRLFELIYR